MICRPLIGIPSPRDIPFFIDATSKLNYPKFWIKYATEQVAYEYIREFFLAASNKRFTHLVILPDDLIVRPEQFEALKQKVEFYDPPVLSGICYVNRPAWPSDTLALSTELPPILGMPADYKWLREIDIGKGGMRTVAFSGFPCIFIRRDIVEKIPFKDNREHAYPAWLRKKYPNDYLGCCIDLMFCYACKDHNIPIHVDFDTVTEHLGAGFEHFYVDEKPVQVFYEPEKNTTIKLLTKIR